MCWASSKGGINEIGRVHRIECQRTTTHKLTQMTQYIVTYSFDGYLYDQYSEPVSLIAETVSEMRRSGIDISLLGATQEYDPSGQLTETIAQYSASSKGTIGRLNCHACLPACGSPQRQSRVETESETSRIALTG